MTKYKNAYTEVYEIIEQLNEEEYNKIPSEVIKAIEENRNTEYEFELDEDIELKDQELLPETKAILFNLFRDYLSTLGLLFNNLRPSIIPILVPCNNNSEILELLLSVIVFI